MTAEILVTHATGKVGREIVKQLMEKGVPFRAAVKNVERAQKILGEDAPLVSYQLEQPDSYMPVLQGVKRLFLLHQLMMVKQADLYAFVDAAKAAGVEQIVFMSALGANEQSDDPICQLEQYIINSGLTYTILRPNWFMQNFNIHDVRSINEQNEIKLPSGDHPLSLIDVRDIAAVAVEILVNGGHDNQAYTLTGSEAVTYGEVAARLSAALGRTITHNSPTIADNLQEMEAHGMPPGAVAMYRWLYNDIERGLTAEITPHVGAIAGRAPITLDQYIQDHVASWQVAAAE